MYVRVRKFLPSARRKCQAGNFLGLFTAENTKDGEKLLSADGEAWPLLRIRCSPRPRFAQIFFNPKKGICDELPAFLVS